MKIHALIAAVLLVGCAKQTPPEAPAPEPVAVAPDAEPEPEPEPEPRVQRNNADLDVDIVHADGTTTSGRVIRIERTEDWYGDEGWTDAEDDLTVTLEGKGTEVQVPWSGISAVDVTYAGKSAVDCSFDSGQTPVMYQCVMGTDTKVKTREGETWTGADRHKWRFVFEDGTVEEFWIHKLSSRAPEDEAATGDGTEQDTALYQQLQKELLAAVSTKAPKRIVVKPRVGAP